VLNRDIRNIGDPINLMNWNMKQ